jgi:hypothetical protein
VSSYFNWMGIRKLFATLVAVAVLFAPALMTAGMAQAAVPDHHARMMEKGHCDSATGDEQEEPADMSCCGAMCMAVAVPPSGVPIAEPLIGSVPVASLHSFQTGNPAELATPPPRAA